MKKRFKNLRWCLLLSPLWGVGGLYAQQKDLGDKEYVIVKDYRPVLAESNKISDTPEGDTTTSRAPKMEYSLAPKKLETNFEAGVIKAVKIKDEPIPKLYHSLIKLGLGNYSTYYGEIFYNTLRSKNSQVGVHLNHLSGAPKLNDTKATFSKNNAEVYGKYFLDNSTFTGSLGFDRTALHYYGFNSGDTIPDPDSTKQRFNHVNLKVGYGSNWLTKDHLDYQANFEYHTLSDLFDVTENNFILKGGLGKKFGDNYFGLFTSFDYFKKADANFEKLDLLSDLSRNIITLSPYMKAGMDKVNLKIGINFAIEKNLSSTAHFYPDINLTVPIAEHIIYVFADVTGNLQKVNFRSMTDENPFTISSVKLSTNQSNNLIVDGGVKGNFSSDVSFNAMVKYSKVGNMLLFYNDTLSPEKFNVMYDDGTVLNLHAEISYRTSEKLNIGVQFDQYTYTMDVQQKPWFKPMNETKIFAKYNLQDKIVASAVVNLRGSQYARLLNGSSLKMNGYVDINLGLEYRYTKILSFYLNLNNLGFSKYRPWYRYPTEGFNVLGGLTYAF